MDDADLDRRFGPRVPGWTPPPRPGRIALQGRHVALEPLSAAAHADDLFRAYAGADSVWDYLPYGPFPDPPAYQAHAATMEGSEDPRFLAFRDAATGRAAGVASFLRIDPANGVIEVGHICLAPAMQRTVAATEGLFLMMRWAFGAGYRRCEWKGNALNLPSRRAAQRLGFAFEGVFRQAAIVKGRNRDTAWFSVIDGDWPGLRAAFGQWLDPANFDAQGRQRRRLTDLTRPLVAAPDPALAR